MLHGGVLREEERRGLQMSRPLHELISRGIALAWAEGHELAASVRGPRLQEGDLVGALQKTLDLIGQLRGRGAPGRLGAGLVPLLDEADALLRRGVVSASYQWALEGPPDTDVDSDSGDRPSPDQELRQRGELPRRPAGWRRGPRKTSPPRKGPPKGPCRA